MSKTQRLQQIRDILARNEVRSQEQLLALLETEGVSTTQATLSRDLRELGVRKHRGGYELPATPGQAKAKRKAVVAALKGKVLGVWRGGTIVVLRTQPGHAQPVAVEIGGSDLHEVLGTISGVDTVFIATGTAAQARELTRLLEPLVR